MKNVVIVLAFALLVAAIYGSAGHAQAPAPDVGDINLLVLACDHAKLSAGDAGLTVRNCRRAAPEEIDGNRALVHIRVATNETGVFLLDFNFQRSLWTVQYWTGKPV